MKFKYLITFVLAVAMVFAAGCSKQTGPSMTSPFIGGTTGLTMEFIDGAPPEEVYDGGNYPFTAVVKVENIGESDIAVGDAKITISGIDAADFGTESESLVQYNSEDIIGAKKNAEGGTTEGTILHMTFPKDSEFNYGEALSGNIQFPFLATACYKYENKANAMLCVKDNPLETKESVCVVDEIKEVYNSGGPIQILNFAETPRGKGELAFTFEIWHQGTGSVFELNTECDDSIQTKDKVYISVDTGIDGLECTGLTGGDAKSGYVTLYEGKRSITCTQDVSSASGDYEKVVEIITQYDYEQEITTNVLVKHAAE